MTLCTLATSWFCWNPSAKMIPLKYLIQADFKSSSMKSDHRKMRGLIAAVIAGTNQVMEIGWHNGAWNIQRALQLYGGMKHLFAYLSKSAQVRRNDQISWRTVYNIYTKNGKTFGMVQAWVAHFVAPLKCTYDENDWQVMSQKPHKKHKQHDKQQHHGVGAAHPSSGVNLMNPCRLRGGRHCACLFQGRRQSDLIDSIN